jgi:branched-chain amino acid transport system ATP-binding protein
MKARLGLDLPHAVRRARGARARETARELLDVRRPQRATSCAHDLPYGDQRRLEIARALASDPSCCCSTSRRPA